MKSVCVAILVLLGLFPCGTGAGYAEEISSTPRLVVHQWLHSYPSNLSQAVTLTSPDFRQNMSPAEWITQNESALKQIGLKYLDEEVVEEFIDGNYALIKVKVF